jgi:chemotaxis protein MotA
MSLVSSRAQCGKILNMELATWLGLLIGFGGIILGNLIEGGHMGSLLQFTAGLIVLMGTVGAVMVSHPM